MKKFLLTTALSCVFVLPAMAEDMPRTAISEVELTNGTPEAAVSAIEPSAGEEMMAKEAAAEAMEDAAEAMEEAAEAMEEAAQSQQVVVEAPAASPVTTEEPPKAHDHSHQAKWGYTGGKAAPYWSTLDPSYELCATGKEQSPINIAKFIQEDLPALAPAYNPSPLTVVNNGHTIQVNFAQGSGFEADGVQYNLLQAHFHTPSEHYLDGAPYPMEVHFVHQTADGTLGVIGVMMKVGAHNPFIEGIWQNAPIQAGAEKTIESVEINAADLMPTSLEYYKYDGSLTTPPCSEGVQWHVMKETIEVSEMQVKAFQALFPVNARPIQSLNDRVVTGD